MTRKNRGFTALEMAVVIFILGILALGAISTASPILKKGRMTATHANMKNIIEVLSVYAQNNNRLPCPANPDQAAAGQPFGYEIGSGADGENMGACGGAASPEGIVPFKTLGISEEEIIDGWKNYITYRVSPVFTLDPDDVTRDVHKRCRTEGKWVLGGDNRNGNKARFCCPGSLTFSPATDITLSDGVSTLWPYVRDDGSGADDYNDSETVYGGGTLTFDLVDDNITVPAFVLVSHGINGVGAYLPDGTRLTDDGTMGTDEGENINNDVSFIIRNFTATQGNAHFDDIIAWRTQDQLYAETGKNTCMEP